MKQHTFEQNHQPQWDTLERWLDKIAQQEAISQEITNCLHLP